MLCGIKCTKKIPDKLKLNKHQEQTRMIKHCQRALAAEGDRGAEEVGSRKKRRSPVAARGGGAGAIEEQVGRKARCRAPGLRRGGCRPRGSGGVGAVSQEAGACCHPPCLGRSRERGTRCRCSESGFSHLKLLTLGHPKPRIKGILGYL